MAEDLRKRGDATFSAESNRVFSVGHVCNISFTLFSDGEWEKGSRLTAIVCSFVVGVDIVVFWVGADPRASDFRLHGRSENLNETRVCSQSVRQVATSTTLGGSENPSLRLTGSHSTPVQARSIGEVWRKALTMLVARPARLPVEAHDTKCESCAGQLSAAVSVAPLHAGQQERAKDIHMEKSSASCNSPTEVTTMPILTDPRDAMNFE